MRVRLDYRAKPSFLGFMGRMWRPKSRFDASKGLPDIEALCAVEAEGISGVITGRAIYEGTIDFRQALALAENSRPAPERVTRQRRVGECIV